MCSRNKRFVIGDKLTWTAYPSSYFIVTEVYNNYICTDHYLRGKIFRKFYITLSKSNSFIIENKSEGFQRLYNKLNASE